MLGFGTIAKKVFGTANDRKVKAARPLVDQINALEPEFEALSDAPPKPSARVLEQVPKTLHDGAVLVTAPLSEGKGATRPF